MSTDTIAAIATAAGLGGIGIIRLSGPEAESILRQVFRPAGHRPFRSHVMEYGFLTDGEETLDEGMAVLMSAPRSYTREDVAELHLHGGAWILHRGLDLCLRQGARLAEPGEFTRRAFLNGRIDLSRAEAVMAMISARGEQERKAAMLQLSGGTESFVRRAADELYLLQAGLAACIDYPEEVSDEEGMSTLRPGIEKLIRTLREAVDERASRLLKDGLRVALIGRPNVGKSSLLNALLGEEKAIVTPIPGTTRDLVEGEMLLSGVRVRLTDTAGLRDTEDPVERIGVDRSLQARDRADLVLLVLDGSEPLTEEDLRLLESGPDAVVLNKADLPAAVKPEETGAQTVFRVSALDPESLEPVKAFLDRQAEVSPGLLTQPRHLEAALRAVRCLEDALETLEHFTPDMAATDLQAAQKALAEITGDQADEKLLDIVFSRFCVGK